MVPAATTQAPAARQGQTRHEPVERNTGPISSSDSIVDEVCSVYGLFWFLAVSEDGARAPFWCMGPAAGI